MKDFKNLGFGDWLGILWRRKWYAIVTFLLILTGTVIYALQLPQIFRSETKILIVSSAISEDYVRSASSSSPIDRYNAIRVQLQSRKFLSGIIKQSPLFPVGSPGFSMEDAINSLRSRLKLEANTDSTLVLSSTAADPRAARDLVKQTADALIKEGMSAGKDKAVETDQFIEEQLRNTQRDLAAQEEKIKQFKMAHMGELPEQSITNVNALSNLNAQLASAEIALQRGQDQRRLLDVRARESKRLEVLSSSLFSTQPALPATTAGGQGSALNRSPQLEAKRALLAEANARYQPTHPDVVRLTREVQELEKQLSVAAVENRPDDRAKVNSPGQGDRAPDTKAPLPDAKPPLFNISEAESKIEMEAADNEIVKQEAEKDRILQQIKLYQTRASKGPAIEQEYAALIRDRDMLQQQYGSLHNKKFSAQMSANLEANNRNDVYKIIDEANLPERPIFPDRRQIVLIGWIAGFVLGLGAALGREYLDPTLGDEREAMVVLNLPVLACIPEVTIAGMFRRKRLPKSGRAA